MILNQYRDVAEIKELDFRQFWYFLLIFLVRPINIVEWKDDSKYDFELSNVQLTWNMPTVQQIHKLIFKLPVKLFAVY